MADLMKGLGESQAQGGPRRPAKAASASAVIKQMQGMWYIGIGCHTGCCTQDGNCLSGYETGKPL
jgi:hypothetical protein